jgi:hypothetical protein
MHRASDGRGSALVIVQGLVAVVEHFTVMALACTEINIF